MGLPPLSLLVYSQVLLSLFIPLPMIPLVYYTSRKKVMGTFTNRWWFAIVACAVAGTIVVLNIALLYSVV